MCISLSDGVLCIVSLCIQGSVEDEMNLVPLEFAPLPLSPRPKLPLHCIYVKKEVSMLFVCVCVCE